MILLMDTSNDSNLDVAGFAEAQFWFIFSLNRLITSRFCRGRWWTIWEVGFVDPEREEPRGPEVRVVSSVQKKTEMALKGKKWS